MIKRILFLALIAGIALQTSIYASQEIHQNVPQEALQKSLIGYDDIKAVGERFVTHLKSVGQSDTPVTQEDIDQLFSPSCQKVVNGSTILSTSSDLPAQLTRARDTAGKWTIDHLFTIASTVDKACALQIMWQGEKMTKHTTMVTLFINDDQKITRILEVFSSYEQNTFK
ncbi:MAG: hypothetical protein K2X98_03970 [Alphaproteobacteria bacterium]|nr:hypothetical protein [Alphaproteobacteria bacterium]